MAERQLFSQTPGRGGKKPKQFDYKPQPVSTAANDAFMDVMIQANSHIANFLDRTAQEEGKQAGLKAAKEGEFKEEDSLTIRSQAFNAAGREGYKVAMGNEMSTGMAEIYSSNKHDPKSLGEALDKYQREMIGSAESTSPEAALALTSNSNRQIQSYLSVSRDQAEATLIATSQAEVAAGSRAMLSNTQFIVRNVEPGISMPAAAQARAEYERMLYANGPQESFADKKSLYLTDNTRELASKPDANRTGALTPKQIQLALKGFDDAVVNEKYMWGMDQAVKAGNPVDYVRSFVDNPNPNLTIEQSDTIKKNMYSALANYSKQQNAIDAQDNTAREDLWRETETQQTALLLAGQADPTVYPGLVADGSLKSSTARTLADKAKGGGPQQSNGLKLIEYSVMGANNYSEMDIMQDELLTYADRKTLIEERKTIMEDQNNWRNKPSGQQGASDIRGELGIISGQSYSLVSEEKSREVSRALNTYWNRVNSQPIEKRAEMAPRVAMEIVSEIKKDNARKDLAKQKEKLYALPYDSVSAIDNAVKSEDPELTSSFLGFTSEKTEVIKEHKATVERLNRKISKLELELSQ